MNPVKSVTIHKNQQVKRYHFNETISLALEYGQFGYKEYLFRSPLITLFADNVTFNPCGIYTAKDRKEYVMSLYFDKSFPLIHKHHQTRITWTAFNCTQSRFNTVTETVCLKEGEKVFYIKRENSPGNEEKLYYDGRIETNELEFFTCLLYTLHYPEQTASSKEVVWS